MLFPPLSSLGSPHHQITVTPTPKKSSNYSDINTKKNHQIRATPTPKKIIKSGRHKHHFKIYFLSPIIKLLSYQHNFFLFLKAHHIISGHILEPQYKITVRRLLSIFSVTPKILMFQKTRNIFVSRKKWPFLCIIGCSSISPCRVGWDI